MSINFAGVLTGKATNFGSDCLRRFQDIAVGRCWLTRYGNSSITMRCKQWLNSRPIGGVLDAEYTDYR